MHTNVLNKPEVLSWARDIMDQAEQENPALEETEEETNGKG